MQTRKTSRYGGYSDFFFSGFRAFASRNTTRRRPVSIYSLPGISSDTKDFGSKPSRARRLSRNSSGSGDSPKSRRLSALVLHSTSSSQKSSSPPPSDDVSRHKRRHSSIIDFSSKLLEKITPHSSNSSDAISFIQFEETRKKLRNQSVSTEVWITTGGPITRPRVASVTGNPEPRYSIDPFSPSPDSKSIYIELSDSPCLPSTQSKCESFLSFSGSSCNSCCSAPRRDRPMSIQSMPEPLPRSWRSSFHFSRLSRDTHDNDYTLEEESPILPDETSSLFTEELADVDWRQFHIELLDDVQD